MAKNKLSDLNDHFFAQLERLNDETLTEEQQLIEIKKAHAISQVGEQVIKTARLTFEVAKSVTAGEIKTLPEQLQITSNNP